MNPVLSVTPGKQASGCEEGEVLKINFSTARGGPAVFGKEGKLRCWAGAGEEQSVLEGAPQGSWKGLAVLCVCFLEGDLFVGVFVGTCEKMSLESNVCGLCGAVCVGLPRSVVYEQRADAWL